MRQKKKQCTVCLIALIFCLMFVSCKSDEATKVDELIMSIGTVTLDSEPAIETAEIHYQALTEKQKEEVENSVVLVQARRDFDKLCEEEQARLKAEEEARIKAEEEARLKAEAEEAARKAEEEAKIAKERALYIREYIDTVFPLINRYSSNLLDAWAYGINNAYTFMTDTYGAAVDMYASHLDISEDEVRDAMSFALWRQSTAGSGLEMAYLETPDTDELKALLKSTEVVNAFFPMMNQNGAPGPTGAVEIIESIYLKDGTLDEISTKLSIIKKRLKEIEKDTPDYEHLEILKKCYNALKNYYDSTRYFQGTYQDMTEAHSNYIAEIQGYINSLEYAFDS